MKMLIRYAATVLLLFPLTIQAQIVKERKKEAPRHNHNEAGIELGGTGFIYNLYYQQHLFRFTPNTTLNFRIGAAAMPLFLFSQGDPKIGFNANLMPTLLFFKKRHAWETGIAINFFDYTIRNSDYTLNGQPATKTEIDRLLSLAPQVSYRYYFKNNPFYLRGTVLVNIGLTRWNNDGPDRFDPSWVIPWAGISAGITL